MVLPLTDYLNHVSPSNWVFEPMVLPLTHLNLFFSFYFLNLYVSISNWEFELLVLLLTEYLYLWFSLLLSIWTSCCSYNSDWSNLLFFLLILLLLMQLSLNLYVFFIVVFKSVTACFMFSEAEFKEFEPRHKFKMADST